MRHGPIILLGFLFLSVLCGCFHRKIEHQVLERGIQAGASLATSHFAVVTTEKEFADLYHQIHSGELPPPQPPPVDFSESFILLVAMGEKPTAGYAVEIGNIIREGSTLEVEVRLAEPPPEQMQATVITRPYALIRVERQSGLETAVLIGPEGERLAEVPLN